jgi:lipoate-protein ligase B
MHGFALNVLTSCLPAFSQITPCGIVGVQMTSLETESPEPVTLPDVTARAAGMFAEL